MLRTHVLPAGTALLFCLCSVGCAATSNDDQEAPPPEPAEIEEPLELSVDDLALRNGTLRISATMTDGSADVSMWLGGECPAQEVGRGFATRSGFTWALSADELTKAFECGLTVNAHGVNEDGDRVKKVASLDVAAQVTPDETSLVSLFGQSSDNKTMTLTFVSKIPAQHLHVGGSVIGVEDEPEEDDDHPRPHARHFCWSSETRRSAECFARSFVIDNDDVARSLVHRRRLMVLGETFLATVTIGGVTLDVSDPVPEVFGLSGVDENSEGDGDG